MRSTDVTSFDAVPETANELPPAALNGNTNVPGLVIFVKVPGPGAAATAGTATAADAVRTAVAARVRTSRERIGQAPSSEHADQGGRGARVATRTPGDRASGT